MTKHFDMEAAGIRVRLNLELGQLARFEVYREGRVIAPFASVPWGEDEDFPASMASHLRAMAGDFFCAPFGVDDVDGAPTHGWSANSAWDLIASETFNGGKRASFRLRRTIAGARVEKIWVLRDHHPFLYQRHDFFGGNQALSMGHHTMVDLRSGGLLAFSKKLYARTPDAPPEKNRHILSYPAQSSDLQQFPGLTGPIDLCRYPIGLRHEDFTMLPDNPTTKLGWVTALRPAYADMAILIKSVSHLPMTFLWFSNGGRDHAPWSGRHVGVLGIEEIMSSGVGGRRADSRENWLTRQGIQTAHDLSMADVISIPFILGAMPCRENKPVDLQLLDERVAYVGGSEAFDGNWLTSASIAAK